MRDKLIELIDAENGCPFAHPCDACKYNELPTCYASRLADALIARGVTLQQWIPVSERLPKNGEIVLGSTRYGMEVLQWDRIANVWLGISASHAKQYVTHWMPLPEPPKEGGT